MLASRKMSGTCTFLKTQLNNRKNNFKYIRLQRQRKWEMNKEDMRDVKNLNFAVSRNGIGYT